MHLESSAIRLSVSRTRARSSTDALAKTRFQGIEHQPVGSGTVVKSTEVPLIFTSKPAAPYAIREKGGLQPATFSDHSPQMPPIRADGLVLPWMGMIG